MPATEHQAPPPEAVRNSGKNAGGDDAAEHDLIPIGIDHDSIAVLELPFKQLQREWILHQPLDRPLERSGPEGRVVAFPSEEGLGRLGYLEGHPPRLQPTTQVAELDVHDGRELVA